MFLRICEDFIYKRSSMKSVRAAIILFVSFARDLDLPTSRGSKAELRERKIYTMQAKTEREARGRGHLQLRRPRRPLGKSTRHDTAKHLGRLFKTRLN